jgi:PAS domain S-box-containing protein
VGDNAYTVIDPTTIGTETVLRSLVEAARSLASTLDAPSLYRKLLGHVQGIMPCNGFIVSAYHPETRMITCEFCWTDGCELDVSGFPPIPLIDDGGMQSEVIRTGTPKIFSDVGRKIREPEGEYYDVDASGHVKPIEEVEEVKTQTALMVPMRLQNEITGVVQVMTYQPSAYDESHIPLVEGLAHQLALAVQNARLYARAQQEIAERRLAEESATAARNELRQTLDAMPQIAWSRTFDGKIDYVNQRLIEYAGAVKASDVMGDAGWASVVHSEDLSPGRESFVNAIQNVEPWEQEIRLRRHDGEFRWHLSRMVPIRDEEGNITRWFGTSTDIHDVKEAEERLRRLNDELEDRVAERTAALRAAMHELEGFTYSVSHDLRSPLRAISATSSILLADLGATLTEEWKSMLVRQSEAAIKMAKLIDQLLQLSRISRSELKMEWVDITGLAHSVVEELKPSRQAESIQIDEGIEVRGDVTLLRLVLLNLVENAMKFSPAGARIHLARTDDGFCVRDEGIGFDPTFEPKIWLPFERLVTEREFPGTGIGLANVKRIVERHGGEVKVQTAPGQGATFFVSIAH